MLCFEDDDEGHGPLDTHLLTTFSPHRAANCFCWDIYSAEQKASYNHILSKGAHKITLEPQFWGVKWAAHKISI